MSYIACPRCGVAAGAPCRGFNRDGGPIDIHDERRMAMGRQPSDAPGRPRERSGDSPDLSVGAPAATAKPTWLIEADPNAPPRAIDISFRPERTADLEVVVPEIVRDEIITHATRRGLHTEEGGVVLGTANASAMQLRYAGGPGPGSQRTATSYRPDPAHDVAFVNEARAHWAWHGRDSRELFECGQWHLHPVAGRDQPSDRDMQTAAEALLANPLFDDRPTYGLAWLDLIVHPDRRNPDQMHITGWVTRAPGVVAGYSWFTCERARLELKR